MEGGPTFRDEEFAEYKANRGDHAGRFARRRSSACAQLIDALNIPIEERAGLRGRRRHRQSLPLPAATVAICG